MPYPLPPGHWLPMPAYTHHVGLWAFCQATLQATTPLCLYSHPSYISHTAFYLLLSFLPMACPPAGVYAALPPRQRTYLLAPATTLHHTRRSSLMFLRFYLSMNTTCRRILP